MSAESRNTSDEIRDLLRRGDPAGNGETLPPDEVARMRRRILAEVAPDDLPGSGPARALGLSAAAAAVLVSIIVFLSTPSSHLRTNRGPVDSSNTESFSPEPGARVRARSIQQIQFVTPRGTRVIWTLDPDFDV